MYYLVQWEGYGSDESTWEPDENLLTCEQLKEDFWNKNKTLIESNLKVCMSQILFNLRYRLIPICLHMINEISCFLPADIPVIVQVGRH